MHVTLKPSTPPDLEPIVVTGTLFAVGRQEPPFNAYDAALTAKLSRRHARLFEQDGCVYLADLGSLNGTSCNGEAVKHVPVALRTGDVIKFGGLAFEVEVEEQEQESFADAEPQAAVHRLVLTPERFKEILEPIVVSSFPFLFDKTSELFARHRAPLREVLAYMSRHHAHIFLRDDELYVEDLGSTNGTYVSGQKLDERAHVLRDGDTIALGSDKLVYSVHLLRASESGTTQLPSGIEAVDNPTRTIFVDSPTSFLDVYFVGERAEEQDSGGGASDNGDASAEGPARSSNSVPVQLARTLFGGPLFGPDTRRILAAAVVVALVAGGIWYWQGRGVRAIETAMAREDYASALKLAGAYLERQPSDTEVRELAARSAIQRWVPLWAEQIRGEDFTAASRVVAEAEASVRGSPEAGAVIELMEWATQVRALLEADPGGRGINEQLEHAQAVAELLDWWQRDAWGNARTLDRIAQTRREFQAQREQVYSDVRQLRSQALDYGPLIELDRRLSEALDEGGPGAAERVVEDFVVNHPQFADRRVLREDLQRLQSLLADIDAQRWSQAVERLRDDPFVTAPFADYAAELRRTAMPDEAAMQRLAAARRLWHAGKLDAALAELEELAQGPWSKLGEAQAQRYRALLAGYQRLQAARGQPDYAAMLFEYYGTLQESEDGHLIGELEGEFRDHAEAAAQRAEGYVADAAAAWSAYQRQGGIQPEQRMDGAAAGFVVLAGRLTEAVEALRRCQRIHQQIARPPPPRWADLVAEVNQEVEFQRGQLGSLALHDPAVRERMLDMLPKPLEET